MQDLKLSIARRILPALSLFTAILIALLLFAALFSFSGNLLLNNEAPKAKNGVIDLTNYPLTQASPVKLDGEWDFYWQEFVLPQKSGSASRPQKVEIPASWNKPSADGAPMSAMGYATYQLKLKLTSKNQVLALALPEIGTAFRLFVDQELLASAGVLQTQAENFEAQFSPQVVHFVPQQEEVLLTLHVANYAFNWGGIWHSIYLGEVDAVYQLQANAAFQSVFLIGIFFIVAIYNLIQYSLRSRDLFPFCFALVCLCLAARELLSRQLLGLEIGLLLPFNQHIQVEYLTFSGTVLFFAASLRAAFPNEFRGGLFTAVVSISVVYSLVILVSHPKVFTQYLYAYQLCIIFCMAYVLYCLRLAIARKRPGSKTFLLGMSILLAAVVNDILYESELSQTGPLFGFGMVGMILCQCYLTYSRFVDAVNDRLRLTDEVARRNQQLIEFSQSLEDKVDERTRELAEANRKLDELANTDPLTSLFNRRGMMMHIRQAMLEFNREHRKFSLVLVDVDHFKVINDRFGHDLGDAVLRWLAKNMSTEIRKQDILARWGGEEFLIYLPGTEKEGAVQLAEKIRKQLSLAIPLQDFDRGDITITMGVAEIQSEESFEQCFSRADAALYQGKTRGRDCVVPAAS